MEQVEENANEQISKARNEKDFLSIKTRGNVKVKSKKTNKKTLMNRACRIKASM